MTLEFLLTLETIDKTNHTHYGLELNEENTYSTTATAGNQL